MSRGRVMRARYELYDARTRFSQCVYIYRSGVARDKRLSRELGLPLSGQHQYQRRQPAVLYTYMYYIDTVYARRAPLSLRRLPVILLPTDVHLSANQMHLAN